MRSSLKTGVTLAIMGAAASITFALRAATPDAAYTQAISKIESVIRTKAETVSHEKHLPKIYTHGEKSRYVVVVIHGTFESPNYMQGISEAFYQEGYNVYSILLPGYWQKPATKIDETSYLDWVAEVEGAVAGARPLGEEVLLAGYSVGGLLSLDYHLNHPGEVKGLFLWAPCLQMSVGASVVSRLGSWFSLNGNTFVGAAPDGVDWAYIAPNAGIQTGKLADALFQKHGGRPDSFPQGEGYDPMRALAEAREKAYEKVTVPTFVVYSESDEAVWDEEVARFAESIGGPKDVIVYSPREGLRHGSLAKSYKDAYAWNRQYINPHFDQMVERLHKFLGQNF